MIVLHRKGERSPLEFVQFNPDGRSLFASSYNGATIWEELPSPSPRLLFSEYRYFHKVRFTTDGNFLITNHKGLTVYDLHARTDRLVQFWTSYETDFDLSADGRHIVVTEANTPRGHDDDIPGWIACYALNNLKLNSGEWKVAMWSQELQYHPHIGPTCIAGERLVQSASWDHQLQRHVPRFVVRSLKTGETLSEVRGPDITSSLVASPDGRLAAVVMNARVLVLSVDDFFKAVVMLRNDGKKYFTGIAFHPSGRYLAATSNDATVKLYDTTSWQVAKTYTWNIGRMRSIAFSPDGTLAAAGSDTGKVVVWDVDV
ncbi:MAG: WD40 repeat domain-containing protein [Planctomycetes bacterium]|nr:WD40 repeat domain-containing protein [Planctomycetota bacterium]